MINAVYQLTAPRLLEVTYKEMSLDQNSVIIRPIKLSICKADQRYYQGTRSQSILKKKLPMALIHECVAQVVYDPTGTFKPGDKVVPIPNTPTQQDDVIAENYLYSSRFRASGFDGFLQDYVSCAPDRLVKLPDGVNTTVAAFSELISVSVHAISRYEKIAHSRREKIGIWGDGNLGFITAILLRYICPESDLFVLGASREKLSYFAFAKETYHVDNIPEDFNVDHAFECVGGAGSRSAINQIIDYINPEGTISIMGVSENFVDINTRMILEKGLRMIGSSRSGRDDFVRTVELLAEYPELSHYFENIVGEEIPVATISDIHEAFRFDYNRNFGKTVMIWNK
ncbi:MAG: zinc-binding dehydrogenase [Clostridia bacterium]|nr:zinc-binding dehydrogenase [Clostridia bacterium]